MRGLLFAIMLVFLASCYKAPKTYYINAKPYTLPLVEESYYAYKIIYDVDTTTFGHVSGGLDVIYAEDTIEVYEHYRDFVIDKVKSHARFNDMQTFEVVAYQCDKRGAAVTPIFTWNNGNGVNTTRGYNFVTNKLQ